MNLLVFVAFRECMAALDSAAKQSDKLPHLVHLLCSLQTSLLASCSQQLDSAGNHDEMETLIVQCRSLFIIIIIIVYYAKWQHRQKYNYIHKIQKYIHMLLLMTL